jgi:hypothetical protein
MARSTFEINKFDCSDLNKNIAARWDIWKKQLEGVFTVTKTTDQNEKMAYLFLYGGEDLRTEHERVIHVKVETGITGAYNEAINQLDQHFKPKRNFIVEEYHFRESKQNESESIQQFSLRLRSLAKYCEFHDVDREICSQIVRCCISHEFRKKMLGETNLTLDILLQKGLAHVEKNAATVEGKFAQEAEVNAIRDNRKSHNQNKFERKAYDKNELKCFRCGGNYPHKDSCPAVDKKCRKCDKMGHFASVCKFTKKTAKVNSLQNEESVVQNTFAIRNSRRIPSTRLKIRGMEFNFKIDTGSSIDVMDECSFNKLPTKPQLRVYEDPTFAYNSKDPLKVLGKFESEITHNDLSTIATIVVIQGSGGNLVSWKTSEILNLVKILAPLEKSIEKTGHNVEYWARRFPTVFSGKVGTYKGGEIELHIDENVKPVQACVRNKPFHLEKAINRELDKLLENDIIEEVENEPTGWLSETVVIPKKDSDEVRLCVDMRAPN